MKTKTNTRTYILAVVLIALLIVSYKVIFVKPSVETTDESVAGSQKVLNILEEVERINFDTSILNDQKFLSLKSIEIPLISLPIGKSNPFALPVTP